MQTWQIKDLELEASALKYADEFVQEHALYFLIGIIYLLLVLLAWVLSGALRRRIKQLPGTVHPAIVFRLPGPSAEKDDFNPFPPPHYTVQCDHNDDSR